MTRESPKENALATLALPVALVGFPVAVLLLAIFGERICQQNQSMKPFLMKCGFGTISLGIIVAILLSAFLG